MKIDNKKSLDAAILELEYKKQLQEKELVNQFNITMESMRPVNIVKDSFNQLIQSPTPAESYIKTLVGIAIGLLTRKLFIGKSSSLVKNTLGKVAEFAAGSAVIKSSDKLKAYGTALYNIIFKRKVHEATAN